MLVGGCQRRQSALRPSAGLKGAKTEFRSRWWQAHGRVWIARRVHNPSHPTPFERSYSGKVNAWRQLASSKMRFVCRVTCVRTQEYPPTSSVVGSTSRLQRRPLPPLPQSTRCPGAVDASERPWSRSSSVAILVQGVPAVAGRLGLLPF